MPVQNKSKHLKSAAAIAAEVADRLAASSSSQYIMTSVLSTFAAEEAKNAGLTTSSTPTTSFSSSFNSPMSKSENLISDPNVFMPPQLTPPQNNPYQSILVAQPSIPGQISSSQAHYHSIPNPTSLQYMQPSGGIAGSYDYGSLPPLPPGPPPPAPPSFMVTPMVPLMQQPLTMGHQQSTLAQQQSIPLSATWTCWFSAPSSNAGTWNGVLYPPLSVTVTPTSGMVYYTSLITHIDGDLTLVDHTSKA
ncbi:UNVERIFIED_CONTAM: hypothetical protein Sradi_0825900 [Sesamum radiatum]|uniref:Uncharacterized protein n=1 Tax=Sesamum radiatum TaxID=300843 RepID=A0AAW2VSJ9_SESRA